MGNREQLVAWIQADAERMKELHLVRELQLSDWCIGAGYIRSLVWDQLHHYRKPTQLKDVDVIYYHGGHTDEAEEKRMEAYMQQRCPTRKWSFKNQARMHRRAGRNEPYANTADAMLHWPEVMTAVGVRLENDGKLTIVSPWGDEALDDLFAMRIRRNSTFHDQAAYWQRIKKKRWLEVWPLVYVEEEIDDEARDKR